MSAVPVPAVAVGVLGEVLVEIGGREVELGGPQPRAVLAALAAGGGRVVPAEALLEVVWGQDPPPSAVGSLHALVSRLRRALGPAGGVIERRGQGYRLALPREALDWCRFEDLADRGRAALAAGRAGAARSLLVEAEALWRGPALADLRDQPSAAGAVERLEERREAARGDRLDADLRLGRHEAVLGELAEAVRLRPLDEARWARLALARYRSGQQAAALEALADARRALVDELGVEPGAGLRELEVRVLRQDPGLDVAAAADAAGARAPGRGDLVGRSHELAALVTAFQEIAVGARFGVVEGEPGIGKTRLLEEVASVADAGGALVLWGRSHEGGAAPAFWPWLPVLRALRELDPAGTEEGLAALLDARGGDAHPAGLFGVLDAVAQAVRRTSARRQLVLLLDDLQWADAASLELVRYLATHLQDEPVLLLGTVREVESVQRDDLVAVLATIARRRGSRRLRLSGLDADGTAALVRQTVGGEVDEEVLRAVHERAEGNPFFAAELTRLLDGSGRAGDVADPGAVPAGVRDVVRQRLAGLPARTVALLQVCALVGRRVDLGLLPLVTGDSVATCLADLDPAVVHRVLTELDDGSGGLHFAHALVREVVVDDLSGLRRLQLHLQVADALDARGSGDDDAELLAEHLYAAVPLGVGERAASALEKAAEVAVRRFALRSAADLLERAVELRRIAGSSREHSRAELDAVVRLTSVRRAMHGFGGVSDLLERGQRLARQAGREDVERELAWATWAMADTACDFARAEPIAVRFRDLAGATDDPLLRAFGLSVWGIQCYHHGRLLASAAALDAAAEALAAGKREPLAPSTLLSFQDERELLAAAFRLAVHELLEDRPTAGEELAALARDLDPFARAVVSAFCCHGPSVAGDVARVRAAAEPVVAAAHEGLLSFWGSQARMHLGWARICDGDVDGGLALWEDGRKSYSGAGVHTGMAVFLANASIALLHAGRHELAADLAAQASEELTVFREMWQEPVVLLAEAEVVAAGGGDCRALLAAALERAQERRMGGAARRVRQAQQRLGA